MLLISLVVLSGSASAIEEISVLAEKRNIDELARFATPKLAEKQPFRFLRTGGVYGGGGDGWTVKSLVRPDGKKNWLVFSTPIQAEDIGEMVFEWDGERMTEFVDESDPFGVKVIHHEMSYTVNPQARSIHFDDTMKIKVTGNGEDAFFRLPPNVEVKSVTGANGDSVPFKQAGGTVWFNKAVAAQGSSLRVQYDGVFATDPTYGLVNDKEMILAGAMWWPSVSRQASSMNTTMTLPKGWVGITHGSGSVIEKFDSSIYTFKSSLPISVFSASAGKYKTVAAKSATGIKIWAASPVMSEEDMKLQVELSKPVIDFYNRLHPWPYDQYGFLVTPLMRGGALEAYSYATYVPGWLPDEEPHEPAHTFWGGVIPNTYLKSLWNESFATFFEDYYRREGGLGSRQDRRLIFRGVRGGSNNDKRQPAAFAGAATGSSASDIGYARGGRVLEVLEDEIGPAAMRKAIQSWLKAHEKGTVGEWEHFEPHVSAAAGRNMNWFWDQWLNRAGYADFTVNLSEPIATPKGWKVGTLSFNSDPYRLSLEVMVERSGKREFVRVPIVGDSKEAELVIPQGAAPSRISVDPWLRLLRNIEPKERVPRVIDTLRYRQIYAVPGTEATVRALTGRRSVTPMANWPDDLSNVLVVAPDATNSNVAGLLKNLKSPPTFEGDRVTYRGQKVSLKEGAFLAMIELESGGKCGLVIGKVSELQDLGQSRTALVDGLGRVLSGTTEPKTTGPGTWSR